MSAVGAQRRDSARVAGRRANGGRRFVVALAAIVALGAALRVAHTLLVAPWPPGFFNDEAYYTTLAKLISMGEGFVQPGEWYGSGRSIPTAHRGPLFPAALAVLAKLGVSAGEEQRLLGVLTGAGTIAALGLIGRRLAGERAGLLAAGLAALAPTLVAADGALMTESLFGVFVAFALLAALRLAERPSAGRAVAVGALTGLAALARAEALLMLPLLLVPLLRRPGGARAAVAACLAFAVVLGPWFVRNLVVFDRPVLVATEAGDTLAGANCEPSYHGRNIGSWQVTCVPEPGSGNEAVQSERAGREGLRYAREHAGRVPLVLAARLARTWGVWPFFQRPEGRRDWVMKAGVVVFWLLVPLAVLGGLELRRRRVALWIVCVPLVTVTLTTLASYGALRFRHSAELTVVVLAAVGLDRLWRRVRDDRRPARGESGPPMRPRHL